MTPPLLAQATYNRHNGTHILEEAPAHKPRGGDLFELVFVGIFSGEMWVFPESTGTTNNPKRQLFVKCCRQELGSAAHGKCQVTVLPWKGMANAGAKLAFPDISSVMPIEPPTSAFHFAWSRICGRFMLGVHSRYIRYRAYWKHANVFPIIILAGKLQFYAFREVFRRWPWLTGKLKNLYLKHRANQVAVIWSIPQYWLC